MEKRKFEFEVEINFKEVFRNPARWFGYVFIYVVAIIFILGLIFLGQIDHMFKNAVAYTEIDSSRVFQDNTPKKGGMVQGVKFEEISTLTPELEQKGNELYKSTCASCHGDDGKGKGVASAGLNPPPRDFTNKEGWKNGATPLGIYTTLQQGISGSAMVAYDYIPPIDKLALIYHIFKFLGVEQQITQQDYDEINSQFNISESRVEPNVIPIAKAKELIADESIEVQNRSKELSKKLSSGNLLTSKFVKDPNKAANFILHIPEDSKTNLTNLIVTNIPRNGFSYEFIKTNEKIKNDVLSEIIELKKQ